MTEYTCRWQELDGKVGPRLWGLIADNLVDDPRLCLAATCTDSSGQYGSPYIMTEICWKDDVPFFKAESRKAYHDPEDAWKHTYFIAADVAEVVDEDDPDPNDAGETAGGE